MYKLTNNHIKEGTPLCGSSCPMALCLRENLNEDIYIYSTYVYSANPLNEYAKNNGLRTYQLSEELQEWIKSFDKRNQTSEITLVLDQDYFHREGETFI